MYISTSDAQRLSSERAFLYSRLEASFPVLISLPFIQHQDTIMNLHWNIPKHLANFTFTDHPDGSVSIAVHPLQPNSQGVESIPSKTPFFSATYKPMSHSPSFYSTTNWAKYVGLGLKLVAPPLPEGKGQFGKR
jgi:hypothetical protein